MKKDYLISLEWNKIDTHGAHHYTDKQLLEVARGARIGSGWGLIAELCKRLAKRVENDKK